MHTKHPHVFSSVLRRYLIHIVQNVPELKLSELRIFNVLTDTPVFIDPQKGDNKRK